MLIQAFNCVFNISYYGINQLINLVFDLAAEPFQLKDKNRQLLSIPSNQGVAANLYAMKITEKAFTTGSEYPELAKDTLRIYSMRFCPWAQTTRMVLAHKGIDCEVVNIDLTNKPEWYFKKNPMGKVPVLEYNDKIVYESAVCDEYLDDVYPQNKLKMDDPYARARHKMLLEHYGVVVSALYKILVLSGDSTEVLPKAQKELDRFEEELEGKTFFGGDKLSMLDIHMWPFMERVPIIAELDKVVLLPKDRYPRLLNWVEAMHKTAAVSKTAHDLPTHVKYAAAVKAGNTNYDHGLE